MNYNQQPMGGANYGQVPQYQPPQPNYNNYKKPSTVDTKHLFTVLSIATSVLSFAFFLMPFCKKGVYSATYNYTGISMMSNGRDHEVIAIFAFLLILGAIGCSVASVIYKNRMINIGTISAMGLALLLMFVGVLMEDCSFAIGFFFFLLSSAASITFSALLLAKK